MKKLCLLFIFVFAIVNFAYGQEENPVCSTQPVVTQYTFDAPLPIKLGAFLSDIRGRFFINFIAEPEIMEEKVIINATNVPWNILVRSQLRLLNITYKCLTPNLILLSKKLKPEELAETPAKKILTAAFKLKYIKPLVLNRVNLAGQSRGQQSKASIEELVSSLKEAAKSFKDDRIAITSIPNTSEIVVTGPQEFVEFAKQFINKADRPPYRVQVHMLIYTLNTTKLSRMGGNLGAIFSSSDLEEIGGVSNLAPANTQTQTRTQTQNQNPGNLVPGGVRTFGQGFPIPQQSELLSGGSFVAGTAQFFLTFQLLETKGIANRVEKLRTETNDSGIATLETGRQIPVLIQAVNNIGAGLPGTLEFINAGSSIQVTPYVIEDENGKPYMVNLSINAESNLPDPTLSSIGGLPAINSRRLQTDLTLKIDEVYTVGISNDISQTQSRSANPPFDKIPLLGYLFKRKNVQNTDDKLYFAIWVEVSQADTPSTFPTTNIDKTIDPVPPISPKPLQNFNKNQTKQNDVNNSQNTPKEQKDNKNLKKQKEKEKNEKEKNEREKDRKEKDKKEKINEEKEKDKKTETDKKKEVDEKN